MDPIRRMTLLVGLSMFASSWAGAALASDSVERCEGADGQVAYTDGQCAALGASSTELPEPLRLRLASEARRENARSTLASTEVGGEKSPPPLPVRRPLAAGCATTPTQLSMDLVAASGRGDVNALAASFHWVGASEAQARSLMQRVDSLAQQPLESARFFNARIGSSALQSAGAGAVDGSAGIMQLVFAGSAARRFQDLGVIRHSGCYFLRF